MPWRMPLSSGSEGRSTHWPFTSYFHPWYGQRSPHSSLRPNHSDTPRWAQNSSIRPSRPSVSRKATSFSPRSFTRTGGQSRSGSSQSSSAGIQYRRNSSPIGAPGPVRVRKIFISSVSMGLPCSTLAHPGAVDIDPAAECEKPGQLARALHFVQGPQELREPRCALRAGDRLDVFAQLLIEVRVVKGILVVPGERPRIAVHDRAVVELDLHARQVSHLHALVLAHGVRTELGRGRASDFLDERLPLRVENHLRGEARHPDGAVQDRGRDDIGQGMVGGLARDGIPRVLAYLDQVIVGAFLGEHAYLFDPGKILDPGPGFNGGLYGALRHGADRPALHEGRVHPLEREARVQPPAQH